MPEVWDVLPVVLAGVWLLGLLVAVGGEGGTLPTVRQGHPRLFVRDGDLPRLRSQAVAYGQAWERMLACGLAPPEEAQYGDGRRLVTAALVYLVTKDERYLASVWSLTEHLLADDRLEIYATPEAVLGLAAGYDWCCGGMSAEQRSRMAEGLLRLADYLRGPQVWRHGDFSNHFLREKTLPQVLAGVALAGDTDDPRVGEMLAEGWRLTVEHAMPAADMMAGESGGEAEGYGYDAWGYTRPLALAMEAWRVGAGEDLFPMCSATRNNALWHIYGRRPFDGRQEHFDDCGLGARWSAEDHGVYMYLLAARYRDGYAQWLGDEIPRDDDMWLWPIILWRDPEVAARPPDDLPLARRFEGLGWVLMRSSWGPEATFASFQSGRFYAVHQHLDNNAFTIHKHALLALDAGVNMYGERVNDRYRANYYSRTIAHNTVTVVEGGETFPSGPWGSGALDGANDGGQVRLTPPQQVSDIKAGDSWDVGELLAYRHHGLFTYAVGDATRSYSPHKLRRFVRHFLFLPPDLFVVFDQVVLTNPALRTSWLLHSVTEPEIEHRVACITNAGGRLFCQTLLPRNAAIGKVGGPGAECWVEGENWISREVEEWPADAGSWRLVVHPATAGVEHLFLHVLQAGPAELEKPAAGASVVEAGWMGAKVSLGEREYVALFSAAGPTGRLRVAEAGRVVFDEAMA
jgi:hypothetical protein